MPAVTKGLRQPSSVPTRSNRNDSNAPTVKELVYEAAMQRGLVLRPDRVFNTGMIRNLQGYKLQIKGR
jgi:hypothetical protein